MNIIPAIDIINGKCVRLSKGDYSTQKIYNGSPLEVAKEFESFGISKLHLVDLDGARSNRIVNRKVLEQIAMNTSLSIDFGGGLKSDSDVRIAFESGANQITGGSVALRSPDLFIGWLERFGSEKIILGADCNHRKIATNGWLEESNTEVLEFIASYEKKGVRNVISTDISKDGMLSGPAFDLYEDILRKTNINLIASGGITTIEDVLKLKEIGCSGAIIGKAIYEGTISLKKLSELC